MCYGKIVNAINKGKNCTTTIQVEYLDSGSYDCIFTDTDYYKGDNNIASKYHPADIIRKDITVKTNEENHWSKKMLVKYITENWM